MARKAKLADVARAAGVSQGTVSNVFNRPELVRPEIRERVTARARELGYGGADPKGRLLRAGKVNAIGVVVSEKLIRFFDDPFNREFMAGVAEVCDRQGAGVSLISAADERTAAWSIETALVDGFIVPCTENGSRLVELAHKRNIPFVSIDLDAGPDTSSLSIDDSGGGRQSIEHLLGLGHRRIGILSLELMSDGRIGVADRARRAAAERGVGRDRLGGYLDALAAAGIAADSVPVVESTGDRPSAEKAAAIFLDLAPEVTAVAAMSDVLALALMREAARRGKPVPAELSIVGFDDVREAAESLPPLTTVHQPIAEKGRRAAELILNHGAPVKERLPVSLVVRQTTAPVPR